MKKNIEFNKIIVKQEIFDVLMQSKTLFIPKSKEELYQSIFYKNTSKAVVSYSLPACNLDNTLTSGVHKDTTNNANVHLPACFDNICGKIIEAEIVKCKNGIAVNFCQDYMRKRDPNSMYIADNFPTDKPIYKEHFGADFEILRQATFDWLKKQDLVVLPFLTGGSTGYQSLLIAPKNASFFGYAMSLLQYFVNIDKCKTFEPQVVIILAPPFRHTHFGGKQVVVHNRTQGLYELFSYNLYPGPSAKKGLYGFLLHMGSTHCDTQSIINNQLKIENKQTNISIVEKWITAHASCVKVITPYENELVIMHEGASGGGKTEMCEPLRRQQDGRILIATNSQTDKSSYIVISENSELQIVGDDMLECHTVNKNLIVSDAEVGWFLRVDNIKHYGSEPLIENISIHTKEPLCFLNIEATPNTTCLIWEHSLDNDGNPNQNPRLIIPRNHLKNSIDGKVAVDVRSFGIRTPPSTRELPTYGILGMLHILPPALAWIWRLIAPRGYNNPSIVADNQLTSEGVGSFWPFASGKFIDLANILLEQIINSPNICYILLPNQHIGCYKVGFSTQWIVREYLARRGSKFNVEYLRPSPLALLGYEPNQIKINGQFIPNELLHPYEQIELGMDGYNKGAEILTTFAKQELKKYYANEMNQLGKSILDIAISNGKLEDYIEILPL